METETKEERLARKAAAKALKKERKSAQRQMEVEMKNDENGDKVKGGSLEHGEEVVNTKESDIHGEEGMDVDEGNVQAGDHAEANSIDDAIEDLKKAMPSITEQLRTREAIEASESRDESIKKRVDADNVTYGEIVSTDIPPMTLEEGIKKWELHENVADVLRKDGIESFFPIQRVVISILIKFPMPYHYYINRHICASAPTGSGKTLSYVIPIVNNLRSRKMKRLRALVILPSRELAMQVYRVFCRVAMKTTLKIALLIGQNPFYLEQDLLVGERPSLNTFASNDFLWWSRPGIYGKSMVDIAVCTPGRLIEHIEQTEGFTLQHLQYLVMDEADRLLSNSFNQWIRELMDWDEECFNVYEKDDDFDQHFIREGWNKTFSKDRDFTTTRYLMVNGGKTCGAKYCLCNMKRPTDIDIVDEYFKKDRKEAEAKLHNRRKKEYYMASRFSWEMPKQPPQKLLFSATLTNNPRKLAMLHIENPLIVKVGHDEVDGQDDDDVEVQQEGLAAPGRKYELPKTLTEAICICDTEKRPFYLTVVLAEATGALKTGKGDHVGALTAEDSMCLIFSSSIDSTHRVCRMLQLMNNLRSGEGKYFNGMIAEMSSSLTTQQRADVMQDASNGKIKILVCTDQMARGIDLANVTLVINYDPPKFASGYVHRVGRTARAGRSGHCMTMLKYGQVGAFKQMKVDISSSSALRKAKIPKEEPNKTLYKLYVDALGVLGKFLNDESDNRIKGGHNEDVVIEFLLKLKQEEKK